MQDPEQGRLVTELTNDIKDMPVEDLWKVHQAVNEVKYAANQQKYRKRGLLLTPPMEKKEVTFILTERDTPKVTTGTGNE